MGPIAEPGFEPALAVVGSISAVVSVVLVDKRNTLRAQHQSVSKSSVRVVARQSNPLSVFICVYLWLICLFRLYRPCFPCDSVANVFLICD